MKSRLMISPHSVLKGESIIEIWWGDKFIGTVYGADGPGIRIISKYPIEGGSSAPEDFVACVEVKITPR